ncbi:MAG: hypothetical protein WC979_03250 [Candidatus Pacearchaeota archaeon]|jgi:hypothetical protein|nr:hypothetical protein [Clostridia bacterium]
MNKRIPSLDEHINESINEASKDFDVEKWWDNLKSVPALIVKNKWNSLGGKIGMTSASFCTCKPSSREEHSKNPDVDFGGFGGKGWELFYTCGASKTLDKLPTWRPLTYTWDVNSREYVIFDNWDDIKDWLSDIDNQTIYVWKHPRQ